jgi:hypothetical protein
MASLRDFFLSKVRIKLLKIFLQNPDEIYYVRELVRMCAEEINAVRRELLRMDSNGMVFKEKRGNRLYYGFKKDYLYFNELVQLVAKSTGLGGKVIKERNRIGKIKFAILSGKYVRHLPHKETDVELMVVGEVVMSQISTLVEEFEKETNRVINYSVMTKEDFEFRKKRRDPFLYQILMGSRVMLIGDEEELVS